MASRLERLRNAERILTEATTKPLPDHGKVDSRLAHKFAFGVWFALAPKAVWWHVRQNAIYAGDGWHDGMRPHKKGPIRLLQRRKWFRNYLLNEVSGSRIGQAIIDGDFAAALNVVSQLTRNVPVRVDVSDGKTTVTVGSETRSGNGLWRPDVIMAALLAHCAEHPPVEDCDPFE